MKHRDDRPRPLWRLKISQARQPSKCPMRNMPLAVFICPRTETCDYICSQKDDQVRETHYVDEQLHKMRSKVRAALDRDADSGRTGEI